MIIPATIIAILPDDRLVIEFKVDGIARRCYAPHPMDMHPDTGVGSKVKVNYSDEYGVERLNYPTGVNPYVASIAVPVEMRQHEPELVDDLAEDRAVFRMSEAEVDDALRASGHDPVEVGKRGSKLLREGLAQRRMRSEHEKEVMFGAWPEREPVRGVPTVGPNPIEVAVQSVRNALAELQGLLAQQHRERSVFMTRLALTLGCGAEPEAIVSAVRKLKRGPELGFAVCDPTTEGVV